MPERLQPNWLHPFLERLSYEGSDGQPVNYEYDVAISFLAKDDGLARELRDLLASGLRVFEFTSCQTEIAGTDGLVTFKKTFRDAARLVVVLYRDGWGDTPWTRIESEAITDRFLNDGPDFLLFVMVDSTSTVPPWVPDRKIRFNLEDFGIDQAVGAIKLRVKELGGVLIKETIAEKARRAAEAQQFAAETEALRRDRCGVEQVTAESERLVTALLALVEEAAAAAPGLGLQWAAADRAVGIRSPRASLYVQLIVNYVNTLEHSFLSVRQMKGNIILPGENRHYLEDPPVISEVRYKPERSPALGWCWKSNGTLLGSDVLAEQAIGRLFERLEASSRRQD